MDRLPPELLLAVLRWVSARERGANCALVCRRWRDAALDDREFSWRCAACSSVMPPRRRFRERPWYANLPEYPGKGHVCADCERRPNSVPALGAVPLYDWRCLPPVGVRAASCCFWSPPCRVTRPSNLFETALVRVTPCGRHGPPFLRGAEVGAFVHTGSARDGYFLARSWFFTFRPEQRCEVLLFLSDYMTSWTPSECHRMTDCPNRLSRLVEVVAWRPKPA